MKRIIHRDLKLNNIVFVRPNSREIRVVDFGISGLYAINNPEKSLAGSLKYMAPEILTGKNTAADPAIDIFSLGCILFALVTGRLPFDGSDNTVIRKKIIKGSYSYPSAVVEQLSPECKDLIDRMLKTNPLDRI
jgi:serine/threonine protein kinase